MKPGTFIRLPDGREGTVVYHGLDGYGIRFGHIQVPEAELLNSTAGEEWSPEALLRDPFPTAKIECVGEKFDLVETP
jgi:hypothetical protein